MHEDPIDYPELAENDLNVLRHQLIRHVFQLSQQLVFFFRHLVSQVGIETWVFLTHFYHK